MARKKDKPVTLGGTYTDSITGFEGVATVRSEHLYGCIHVLLEGTSEDGTPKEFIVDEQRLTSNPAATSGGSVRRIV